MKVTIFLAVIVASLAYLVPIMKTEKRNQMQAQEESPVETINYGPNTFKITYTSQKPSEDEIADIIWMKKAAEVAKNEGITYFNVLEQKSYQNYSEAYQQELTTVEGIIELDADVMEAEYDAQEIESLVLPELVE